MQEPCPICHNLGDSTILSRLNRARFVCKSLDAKAWIARPLRVSSVKGNVVAVPRRLQKLACEGTKGPRSRGSLPSCPDSPGMRVLILAAFVCPIVPCGANLPSAPPAPPPPSAFPTPPPPSALLDTPDPACTMECGAAGWGGTGAPAVEGRCYGCWNPSGFEINCPSADYRNETPSRHCWQDTTDGRDGREHVRS